MAAAVIGALRVVLGADTAAFDDGLKAASKRLDSFHSAIQRAGAVIGVALVGAATAFGMSIKGAIDEADKLGKMSQSFGIPVEQLSALKLAADLSGVSIEEVGKAVGKLSRAMSEIAGGKQSGSAVDAFRALGINVRTATGELKSSNLVLEEVADKFSKMQDGAGKTALAIAIFGRSGANMIPMLNQGAAGLKEMAKEAEELGLIVDLKTAKAAEDFNDNVKRLHLVNTAFARQLAFELLPSLKLLTQNLIAVAKDSEGVKRNVQLFVGVLGNLVFEALSAGQMVQRLGVEMNAFLQVALAPSWKDMKARWAEFQEEGRKSEELFRGLRTSFQDFQEQAKMLADHVGNVASSTKKIEAPVLAAKGALDQFFKSQEKSIASAKADAETVGMEAGAREKLRVTMQAEAIAREDNIRLTAAHKLRIEELGNAASLAAQQMAGRQLIEEALPAWQAYENELRKADIALKAVGATSEQVGLVQQRIAEKAGQTWQQVTASAAGGFAQLATEMGKSSRKMAMVGQAFGIIEATINTFVAYTKALASAVPPWNYIAAAGVLAAGMAKVLAIKSQKIPSAAIGGDFMVRGGSSGFDNQLVSLNAASGERIRVDSADDVTRQRTLGASSTVSVPLHGDVFSRGTIERWLDAVNDVLRDRSGVTLQPI